MGNQSSLNLSPGAMMGVILSGPGPGGGLVGGSGGLGSPQPDLNMSGSDFMNNMNSMEHVTGTGRDGDVNIERDFAQWFNPDDVAPQSCLEHTGTGQDGDINFERDFAQWYDVDSQPYLEHFAGMGRDCDMKFKRDFMQWFNPDDVMLVRRWR